MELAALAWLHYRDRRVVQLPVLCAVYGHARFPVGKPVALRHRWNLPRDRTRSRVWTAAILSWQDLRLDICIHRPVRVRLFRLRNFLCPAAGTAFGTGAESGRTSATLRPVGSKRQT